MHQGTQCGRVGQGHGGCQNSNLFMHTVLCLTQPAFLEVSLLEIPKEQTTGLFSISLLRTFQRLPPPGQLHGPEIHSVIQGASLRRHLCLASCSAFTVWKVFAFGLRVHASIWVPEIMSLVLTSQWPLGKSPNFPVASV